MRIENYNRQSRTVGNWGKIKTVEQWKIRKDGVEQ